MNRPGSLETVLCESGCFGWNFRHRQHLADRRLWPSVELQLFKKRACFAKNLADSLQLAILTFEFFHPLALISGRSEANPLIILGLTDLSAQRPVSAANLSRDRTNGAPLRSVLVLVRQHHSYQSLMSLRKAQGGLISVGFNHHRN